MSDDEYGYNPPAFGKKSYDDDDDAPYGGGRQDSDDEREKEEQRREEQRREEERKKEQRREEERKKEAAKKNDSAKKGKRKGLGGLSREKRKMLKQVIMQKAANDMKEQMAKKKEEKDKYLKSVLEPFDVASLNDTQLQAKVKEYHKRLMDLEGQKYDLEQRMIKQEFEMNELTLKVNDVKGKFVKPVLKKVSKTDTKMAKFKHTKENVSFRDQLKSTGQNKFALEEKDESKPQGEGGEAEANIEIEVEG